MVPRGNASGQQIAAGRSFPIQHFASDKNARMRLEHERVIHRLEPYPARTADGLCEGSRPVQANPEAFDLRGQNAGVVKRICLEAFAQQPELYSGQTERSSQVIAERLIAARSGQSLMDLRSTQIRKQVEMDVNTTILLDRIAQLPREKVNQTTFDAAFSDDEFPALSCAPKFD
jgi:hypothetical protein